MRNLFFKLSGDEYQDNCHQGQLPPRDSPPRTVRFTHYIRAIKFSFLH